MSTGRERQITVSKKDAFFMAGVTMKHGEDWGSIARMLRVKGLTFKRMVMNVINNTVTLFYGKETGAHILTSHSISRMRENNTFFRHFSCARDATGVTFQQGSRPFGTMEEIRD